MSVLGLGPSNKKNTIPQKDQGFGKSTEVDLLSIFDNQSYNAMYLGLQNHNQEYVAQIERLEYKEVISKEEKKLLGYVARLFYQNNPTYGFMGGIIEYITQKGQVKEDGNILDNIPSEYVNLHAIMQKILHTQHRFL